MTQEEFRKALDEHGLGAHYLDLMRISKPTIRLLPTKVDDDKIEVGRSKIGGMPDLPPSFLWPSENITVTNTVTSFVFFKRPLTTISAKPLAFLAQINLAEATLQDEEQALATHGMLYFFYVADQSGWGYDQSDKDKFAVLYYHGDIKNLQRRSLPSDLEDEGRYSACQLTARAEISLPEPGGGVLDDMLNYYCSFLVDGRVHKLLGYPDPSEIEKSMEWECELATNGFMVGTPEGSKSAAEIALKEQAKDWRLLFQLDSEDNAGMLWGDVGRLYFWIKSADLAACRFDRTWMIMQGG